jgi:carboxymethylenebutenolidase
MAGRKTLLDRVPEMQTPIALWYGAEDQSIKPDELGRIAEAMSAANKHFSMTVFPNTGHGFFCEDRASYNEAAANAAWKGTLDLFAAQL